MKYGSLLTISHLQEGFRQLAVKIYGRYHHVLLPDSVTPHSTPSPPPSFPPPFLLLSRYSSYPSSSILSCSGLPLVESPSYGFQYPRLSIFNTLYGIGAISPLSPLSPAAALTVLSPPCFFPAADSNSGFFPLYTFFSYRFVYLVGNSIMDFCVFFSAFTSLSHISFSYSV